MKYTTLLIDNDDTIMDFADAERQGIKRAFNKNGVPYSEELLAVYSAVNLSFWKRFERGEIEKSDIYKGRFIKFSADTRINFDIDKVSDDYINSLMYGHACLEGAKEFIHSLCDDYEIYIVTNGNSKTQARRIGDCGLLPCYKGVFVSDDAGYQKPDVRYFDYVFSKINERDKSRILIIGDSLTSDIQGGINAGIDTCWYNPRGCKPVGITPTYDVRSYKEIYKCLQ